MRQNRLFWQLCKLLQVFVLLGSLSLPGLVGSPSRGSYAAASVKQSVNVAFGQAAREFGTPEVLLKAICYLEGRLSNHGGRPSIDSGYGCMHLMQNKRANTLQEAAQGLHVSIQQLKFDLPTNIRGGAFVLRTEALKLAQRLPTNLAQWYGAAAAYSHATVRATALLYADALYRLLKSGFRANTESGEVITLVPQRVQPATATAALVKGAGTTPAGCTFDHNVDYPNAVDCIINPNTFDCNIVAANYPHCTYEDANRPTDYAVNYVAIHDTEGSLPAAFSVFQDPDSGASIHYIVDVDGTVYQFLHDRDIGYHVGNYWYNQHSIGIEHVGFDSTGYQWYNAAQYLGSAQLTAYLLQKFNIPLDHDHIVSHGTVPSPGLFTNHVDPGPYWLWSYYLELVHQLGVPFPSGPRDLHLIMLRPATSRYLFGANGTETGANFNFFYLYNGPSTASGRITQLGNSSDITDETNSVETNLSYYYLVQVQDPAGTGDTLYEIWYGEANLNHNSPPDLFAQANLAWLAVPPGAAVAGSGTPVMLANSSGSDVQIFGEPEAGATGIGSAPSNSTFASAYTAIEDGTANLWYEITYNHRQAWVPATSVQQAK